MEHLVWIVLGVLCGLSGAYSVWRTIPRAPRGWAIIVGIGGGSGWLGGFATTWIGLRSLGWLTAIGAGYLVTGWVSANLGYDAAVRDEHADRVDRIDLGDRLRDPRSG
jgi:hypothetical protein